MIKSSASKIHRHSTYLFIRKIRRHLDPRLSAMLFGLDRPTSFIKGENSGLNHPESVIFSPSGDLMAISNAGMHSISLFSRDELFESNYADTPSCTISDPVLLDFVHDTAFSPCGKYLVAEARESHTIAMYGLQWENNGKLTAQLLWSITGGKSKIYFPSAVAIHPSGKLLAVVNRMKNGISLYQSTGVNGEFKSTPFQMITEEDMYAHGLSTPHGIDFSPDGKYLAVTHKRFYANKNPKGESALSMFKMQDKFESGLNPNPVCIVPYGRDTLHCVAFNPTGDKVAISNSHFGIELYAWQQERQILRKLDTISIISRYLGEAPKGVAFTREGKQIAVTTEFNEVLFFNF